MKHLKGIKTHLENAWIRAYTGYGKAKTSEEQIVFSSILNGIEIAKNAIYEQEQKERDQS